MRRFLSITLCLCMILGVIPAIGEGEAVYRSLYGNEVSTLNYLIASTQWDQTVGANVIDTLVEYNSYGEVIPGLAESWELSADELTWTFHLRKGVKWLDCNGNVVAEVTAQDFVDALRYVLTPENESAIEYAVETARIKNAARYYAGEITNFDDVGVKAEDPYTLIYTVESPVPYFLSCLTYGSFMPAYGPLLETYGKEFGTSNDKMYYCGAFIMTEYEPQVKHTYIKNVANWDAEHIYIDRIERYYNSEANTIAPEMALRGEIDSADIGNDILDDWLELHGDIVTRGRSNVSYSYFYCFNFDPQFDAVYEPENWLIAVNNRNFRLSIATAFDRLFALEALEPNDPESVLENTVTPPTFASVNGIDYSALPDFDGISDMYFNTELALQYKAAAVEELTAAGAKLPVIVLLGVNPNEGSDGENEAMLVKQQLEGVLGSDYINIQLETGPSNFLTAVRRAGKYGMLRCNWGADFADPETWADPFAEKFDSESGQRIGNTYNKMDLMLDSDFKQTKDDLTEYYAIVSEARKTTADTAERFSKFAQAEAILLRNAFIIPYKISSAGHSVTKLNIFEGEYAPFGMSNIRYKYQKMHDSFVTADENANAYDAWLTGMGLK